MRHEEDYTDEIGYYYVDNIPICYCMKNCTCSKEGYETEWVLLDIVENTTYDFVLTSLDPIPNLDCDGILAYCDPEPETYLTGNFIVFNSGDPGSLLDWEIVEWPDWGIWFFSPESGNDLMPEDGVVTIDVEVVLPDEIEHDLVGEVLIVNLENSSDYCIIDVIIMVDHPSQIICRGFIQDLEKTNDAISFHAIFLLTTQLEFPKHRFIFNEQMKLPNNYQGYIGDKFVWATFSL